MVFGSLFLAILTVAFTVAAKPAASHSYAPLSSIKTVKTVGPVNMLAKDRTRVKALKARTSPVVFEDAASRRAVSEPITNGYFSYVASVGVGSPATYYNLVVDTGSSNTWVGAGKAYQRTSTSVQTDDSVSLAYGSGNFSGTEYNDTVTIGSLVIQNQGIGVASSSGTDDTDGILGIGPVDLTQGTLSPDADQTIPTVTDNAFSQGLITTNLVAVSFEPATTNNEDSKGELTFGDTDSSKYTGSISYTPITSTSPASFYWGIDQSINYGSTDILSSTAGIVDTGTTLLLIASDAFSRYQNATGATLDNTTGLLTISNTQYSELQDLVFTIGDTTFTLTPNAQIWPRSLNTVIGGRSDSIYLVVSDLGTPSGEGFDFVNGQVFLERFYSVYDTTNKRVGLATTSFTTATTN